MNVEMKNIFLLILLLYSSISISQSPNYRLMLKEINIIESKYELLYDENTLLTGVFEKSMKYRLDPNLGYLEYITEEELQGIKYFDDLQVLNDKENVDVYIKYQSQKYVDMRVDFNEKRRLLRSELMNRTITWRQFADSFEDLTIKLNANEREYREKIEVETELS